MADAKKCDRCGGLYEKKEASGIAAAFVDMAKEFDCRKSTDLIKHLEEKIDLCPKCKNSFKKWFKMKVGAETPIYSGYVPPPSIKTVKSEGVSLDPCPEIETVPVPMSTANTLKST